jgi:hypothetical protein
MKCPKCGYTSFDYNERCPKCNKDLTQDREWINLPSFKPNPPPLLSEAGLQGSGSELDMALMSARDARSIESEISIEDDLKPPEIDFDIPGLSLEEGFGEEVSGASAKGTDSGTKTQSDSDGELKLVLDI